MKNRLKILIVDDEESIRSVLFQVLADEGYEVTMAGSAEEALIAFRNEVYHLVITDIRMEGLSGLKLLQEVKKMNPDTQVIIMTSHATLESALEALRAGAYDFLIKPFEDIDLISMATSRALDKIRLIQENKELLDKLKAKNEELARQNGLLEKLAIRDSLTGVFNHRYFQEFLANAVRLCQRHGRIFSLIFMDVDHFKNFNDTNGHPKGDRLLFTLAKVVTTHLRKTDFIARYGGEEFVIILPETAKELAVGTADKIRRSVAEYPFDGRDSQPLGLVSVSMGVASFPADGTEAGSMIKHADEALYRAKKSGRNLVCT